jgi:mitochondrial import inner membrane translocase subunit TIM54
MAEQPPAPAPGAAPAASTYKAAAPNPALRMMGLPNLPKKLPSRNWMIFWTVLATFSGAIIYDKREKKRATAKWSKAVAHLAKEPIGTSTQLPRKLTILLESPPNEGLRVAQDHYTEYIKPILAASGLDWEFVQGRKEGDIRAAVAEKIRRARRLEKGVVPEEQQEPTTQETIQGLRERNGTPEWTGIKGDIVVGRHTWKEYVRGLHEGWLGPLSAPLVPEVPKPEPPVSSEGENKEEYKKEEENKEEKKPERPPQPLPYNSPDDYPTSSLPTYIPSELSPSAPITFPHILGFSNTFIRLGRFLNRRKLADEVGREVAAVCLAHAREYREGAADVESEIQTALEREERDWPKSVWKEEKPKEGEESQEAKAAPAEKIWTKPIAMDSRIVSRMRRFELQPEDEARASEIVVPEAEIEGWIKGSLRSLFQWAVSPPEPKPHWPED